MIISPFKTLNARHMKNKHNPTICEAHVDTCNTVHEDSRKGNLSTADELSDPDA